MQTTNLLQDAGNHTKGAHHDRPHARSSHAHRHLQPSPSGTRTDSPHQHRAARHALPVAPHSHAGLSPAEAAQIVGDIRADASKGRITPEEATKRFDALGVPPDQRTMPSDLRNEEQRVIDDQFPVGRAQDFRIAYADPGQVAPPMSKELAEFDSSARAWLVGAEFPRDLGKSLITAITKTVQATKAMTPDQLESYGLVEYEKLEKVYGEGLEEKLRAAGHMVEALDQQKPGLKNLLRSKGIGDSSMVANLLIQQSERWHARRKGW